MGVKILVFGKLAEVICLKEMEIADVKDVAALRSLLIKNYPGLNGLNYIVAVNRKVVADAFPICVGDEVALMPPFSGG
ncbi:MAG: MoaD/ThiS family protein [Bacteroidetes bacterium]|jgi:molybdopterin synthase sulfur carrier subunit|nr:MoaD/ThiS family protein [Bacteroidota bacterium]MBL0097168.1 MoaD/ThiS family protein [Bacteroidota bacterium]